VFTDRLRPILSQCLVDGGENRGIRAASTTHFEMAVHDLPGASLESVRGFAIADEHR
jgi:hypothetical protein